MRFLFLTLCLFWVTIGIAQNPGDTTVVQAFTYGSPQDYWFQFPPATERFQKILMLYKLKCNPNQSPACGEWDYTTHTFLYNHLGIYDSTLRQQPSFVVNGTSPDTFPFVYNTSYKYYPRVERQIVYLDTLAMQTALVGAGSITTTQALATSQSDGDAYYIWRASELANAGLSAGYITGLRLNVTSLGGYLNNLKVDLAATTLDTFGVHASLPSTFTTVYTYSRSMVAGWNSIPFLTPFNWDGTSNIMVRFSFDNQQGGNNYSLAADNTPYTCGKYSAGQDYVLDFEGADYIEVPVGVFNTVDSQITISFWQYGDPVQPQDDIVFEALDRDGLRVLNVHLPWSDGKVYWDAGNVGTLLDRASKNAQAALYRGGWNHWVFTKDATTGFLRIFVNGTNWLSFNNKMAAIKDIVKFRIGSGANGGLYYDGWLNEFQVWDTVFSTSIITDWMYKDVDASHPFYQNLRLYYKFDDASGYQVTDSGPHGFHGQMWGAPAWQTLFDNTGFRNYQSTTLRPQAVFEQGSFLLDTLSVVVVDTVAQPPLTIQYFGNTANPTVATDTLYYWEPYYANYVYDQNGNAIDSTLVTADDTLFKTLLPYYERYGVTEQYEIGRFITPYGIGLDLGDGFTWVYDVTDYRPLLADSVHLAAGNWQELLDLKFLFIHGTPARDVIKIENVWQGDFYLNDWDQTVLPKTITLDPAASSFRLKTRASGHHWDNPTNCAEFCPKTHQVYANGVQVSSWQNWTDCGHIPVYPQGGSWLFDRAGWCPGEPVDQYDHELTPYITHGATDVTISYTVETDQYGFNVFHSQLISYGDPNFERDVELMGIISPTTEDEHSRYNPVCNYPVVRIRNLGSEPLTQADFAFGVDGGADCYYTWTGNLAFLEDAEVSLPTFDWNGLDPANPRFHVRVDYPNGRSDQNPHNNAASTPFELVPVYDSLFIMVIRTNAAGNETSYEIRDENDSIVYAGGNYGNNLTIQDTLRFAPGCYKLDFYDSDEDGLSFFLSPDGSGSVRFRNYANSNFFQTFQPDFGEKFSHQFMVGYAAGTYPAKAACTPVIRDTTGVAELGGQQPYVTVYPNPTTGLFLLRGVLYEQTDVAIEVYNMLGAKVYDTYLPQASLLEANIDLGAQPAGTYLVNVRCGGKRFLHKLIKQ